MSSLNRRAEVAVPSLPSELTKTAVPPEEVVLKIWPIKQLLSTFAPGAPIQITLLAVVTRLPALLPKAVLKLPVVLVRSAPIPIAVLLLPVVLSVSALTPLAVLPLPVVLLSSAAIPVAVLTFP